MLTTPTPPALRQRALQRALAALLLLLLASSAACERRQAAAPTRVDLQAAERTVFSQFGEDGVIEKIFEVIEPGPKFCVEFGAYDGVEASNMRNLVINHGWSSFQIEGDPDRAKKLAENYKDYPKVKTLQAWVWPGNVELLFEENGVPKDLDFLVIDIDSNDYYVWRAIHDFRPKVVMIEINIFFPPPERMVVEYHPMNYWDGTYYHGASIQSLYELGKKKGYEMLYQMSWGPNLFFVDAQYFGRFGIGDNSPSALWRRLLPELLAKPEAKYGRDGVPWPPGKDKLTWDHLEIPKKFRSDR